MEDCGGMIFNSQFSQCCDSGIIWGKMFDCPENALPDFDLEDFGLEFEDSFPTFPTGITCSGIMMDENNALQLCCNYPLILGGNEFIHFGQSCPTFCGTTQLQIGQECCNGIAYDPNFLQCCPSGYPSMFC